MEDLEAQVAELQRRVKELERTYEVAPRLPNTSILSDSFLKRSFAVYGHSLVAGFIVAVPIYLVIGAVFF
ncbi:MAG: hypothetical protein HKN29_04505, partial [Rhodothermales bacterium]|nr:hypothetical protein [Rhodothermales bacterium]